MKKLLLSGVCLVAFFATSQTTVYSEDFTTGSTWTLNTVTGVEGIYANTWYISCQEDGQAAGACGTACSISDNSLHVSTILGDAGAAYFEAGGGACTTSKRAESGNISTVGHSTLTLSFDMIGAGNLQDYTELFYSTNGGSSWTSLASHLTSLCCGGVPCTGSQQGLWQNNSYVLPASCENISNLRIAFVWQNLDDGIATDPSFAVDDILITAAAASTTITTTNDVSPASWCQGSTETGTVNFTSTGTYTAGNVYTAQLSDATGSFAAPTAIGTLASTASGNLSINTTMPGGAAAGAGYRVRVVSSAPATVGTDNTANLTIHALPTVALPAFPQVCVYGMPFELNQGTPSGGDYSGNGVVFGNFSPADAGVGTHTITYTYTDGNGCENSAMQLISVDACASLEELVDKTLVLFPNPTQNTFTVESEFAVEQLEIVDISGKTVKTFGKNTTVYDISNLNNGTYFVRIQTANGTKTAQLIKE